MYLHDVWASCVRRWYLVLLCLVLSAGVLVLAATAVKPTFEATASVVLIPPQNAEDPNLNRYMALGGLQESADVLARSMLSEETADYIEEHAPNADYEIVPDVATSAPVLLMTATSPERADAQQMLEVLRTRLPENLRALQESLGIGSDNQIVVETVSTHAEPETVQKTRVRILGVLAAGLVFGSALAVGLIDGLLLRRAALRARAGADRRDDDDIDLESLERSLSDSGSSDEMEETEKNDRRAPARRR